MNEFPLTYDIQRQEEYSRFLPLIKWLLIIPHFFVLVFVFIGAIFAWIFAFFAVIITGRYPRGVFEFLVGVARWGTRVGAYVCLLTDDYPPFTTAAKPGDAVTYDVAYPEQGVNRWRPLVHWILIFPYHLIAAVLGYVVAIISFLSFFTILFTKKIPPGMFEIALNGLRWGARSNVYAAFMATTYPPFEWDPGQPSRPAATAVQPVAGEPPAPTA